MQVKHYNNLFFIADGTTVQSRTAGNF